MSRIRKHVFLDQDVLAGLEELVSRQGHDTCLSSELNRAARLYLRRAKGEQDDILLAPVLERLLNEKFDQIQSWLRSGVWAGATYSATATLLLLELLVGQTIEPSDAKAHLELIRGRAWKMVRKGDPSQPEGV